MKPVVIIAIAALFLIPINVFAEPATLVGNDDVTINVLEIEYWQNGELFYMKFVLNRIF